MTIANLNTWLLVASSVGSTFASAAAILAAWHAWKNYGAIQRVHLEINSRLSQLLALTATASHAEGVAAEKARGKEAA